MGRGVKLTILLTGATGFVGRRLLNLLELSGHDIRLLSRKQHLQYETIICDFDRDPIPLSTLKSVDTVFHLAGFAHDLSDSSKIESLYRLINVDFTVQLAKLAVQSGVKRFVFVSSVKAGGMPTFGKCSNESDQHEPEGMYGKTKREAEKKLLKIGHQSGMHVSIIRSSLVYGPNVKGNLGLMLSGIKRGWFPPLPETGNRRSMIHVDDLVRAIFLVAWNDRANGGIFIATDGDLHSSHEIYKVMCSILGKSIPRWTMPKFVFNIAASLSSRLKYRVDKLLGDECYSSEKLQSIGFKAERSLRDMNETTF